MAKKIVAVNASPRKGWNTDLLISKAAEGAASEGAEIQYFDLYKLDKYTGCVSCFGCKLNGGTCVCKDGLTPVLEAIRGADGLIIGSPNYLTNCTSQFRAIYERLIFQYLTYCKDPWNCNTRKIPVLFIMTHNAPEGTYKDLVEYYRKTFSSFIGPTKTLVSAETLQVNDYSKYNWDRFDPEARKTRRETVFPKELAKAYELGREMAQEGGYGA